MELKTYSYYSKNDPSCEVFDKVKAYSEEEALIFFSERKNIEKEVFTQLYRIKIYEQTKFKQFWKKFKSKTKKY